MSDLHAWLQWAERQMRDVVVHERLHVGLAEVLEGPVAITFRLRIRQDLSRASLQRLLGLAPVFAQALHVSEVRLSNSERGVLVEVPHPRPWTPAAADLAEATTGIEQIAVGLDPQRRVVFWNLRQHPHLLAIGPTQRGKTTALKAILAGLSLSEKPGRFYFAVLGRKRANWQTLTRSAACAAAIFEPAEQEQYAAWLVDLLDRRAAGAVHSPVWITVVDDAHDVLATAHIAGALARVAGLGAEVGLYLFASTQTTGKSGLGQATETNMAVRLVYGAPDAATAARFAGAGGLGAGAVGRTKGDALFVCDGDAVRTATAHCDDAWLIERLPAADFGRPPWAPDTAAGPNTASTGVAPLPPPPSDAARAYAPRGGEEPVHTGATPVQPAPNGAAATAPTPPFPTDRLPTDAEIAVIQAARQHLGSITQTCQRCYGSKNPRTAALVKHACGDALTANDQAQLEALAGHRPAAPAAAPGDLPTSIDLSTPAGRALFAALSEQDMVDWSAVRSPA